MNKIPLSSNQKMGIASPGWTAKPETIQAGYVQHPPTFLHIFKKAWNKCYNSQWLIEYLRKKNVNDRIFVQIAVYSFDLIGSYCEEKFYIYNPDKIEDPSYKYQIIAILSAKKSLVSKAPLTEKDKEYFGFVSENVGAYLHVHNYAYDQYHCNPDTINQQICDYIRSLVRFDEIST